MGARRRAALALAAWMCSACGKSEDANLAADVGAGESIGDVDGAAFVVRSVSAMIQEGPTISWIAVGLTTQDGTECGPVHEGGSAIEVYAYSPTAPVLPGTYAIVGDAMGKPFADAALHTFGAVCNELDVSDGATEKSGTITITATEPRVVGSFDVVTRGVHLAGRFDAVICATDGGLQSVGVLDLCK